MAPDNKKPAPKPDYYGILRVRPCAKFEEIKKAYHKLALVYHPDKQYGLKNATVAFQMIQEAWETLSDEKKRKSYDTLRRIRRPIPSAEAAAARAAADAYVAAERERWERVLRRKEWVAWAEKCIGELERAALGIEVEVEALDWRTRQEQALADLRQKALALGTLPSRDSEKERARREKEGKIRAETRREKAARLSEIRGEIAVIKKDL